METETKTETETNTDIDTNTDTDTDTSTDTNIDTNTDTDTNADKYPGTDTDTDREEGGWVERTQRGRGTQREDNVSVSKMHARKQHSENRDASCGAGSCGYARVQ